MKRRHTNPIRPAIAGLLLAFTALGSGAASAEQVAVYRLGDRVDPRTVANILSAEPQRPAGVRTRSIRLLDDPATVTPSAPTLAAAPSAISERNTPTSLSLPVPFAFDSADLQPDARLQLDAVAEGIRMIAPDRRIVIEGHTDAIGPDAYNQTLSERRAAAVRQYLVVNHGIAEQRLSTIGLGEGAPLDGVNPAAAINRRVQFRGS
jgi:outer membrane protein OmpA-like peptidoglycan-associated protein